MALTTQTTPSEVIGRLVGIYGSRIGLGLASGELDGLAELITNLNKERNRVSSDFGKWPNGTHQKYNSVVNTLVILTKKDFSPESVNKKRINELNNTICSLDYMMRNDPIYSAEKERTYIQFRESQPLVTT